MIIFRLQNEKTFDLSLFVELILHMHILSQNYKKLSLIKKIKLLTKRGINVMQLQRSWRWVECSPTFVRTLSSSHANLIYIVQILTQKGIDINWESELSRNALYYLGLPCVDIASSIN